MSGSVEVAWFAALCDDDAEQLGVPAPDLLSSWDHCREIVVAADRGGFDNVLCPSGYQLGIDAPTFAAAVGPLTEQIRLLVAVRSGELWLPQLARQLASLDQVLGGRLTVNVISSDRPGEALPGEARYQRTREEMAALRVLLDGQDLVAHGEFVDLEVPAPRVRTVSGRCPQLYFGGLSDPARDVAAEHADVYLMWPDVLPVVADTVADLRARAAAHGRTLRFGYRCHVVVRETEAEARAAAAHLVAALDDEVGAELRSRSLDSTSAGVRRQAELRDAAGDEGFVEDHLWTGIGRARSGCGAAIVGDPDQVRAKLEAYRDVGIEAFILSGYPHLDEGERFARDVLADLDHAPLAR